MDGRRGHEGTSSNVVAAGALLRRLRQRRGVSLAEMARVVHYSKGYLSKVETGDKPLTAGVAQECDRALRTGGALSALVAEAATEPAPGESLAPGPLAWEVAAPRPAPDCVGRQRELAALRSSARVAAAGSFRVAWVAGEAGGGKSTLAAAMGAHLAEQGWLVAWGRCPDVSGAPAAWTWVEVARQLLEQAEHDTSVAASIGDRDLQRPAPPIGSALLEGPAAGTSFRIARALAEVLAVHTRRQPVLIVLDDVHRDRGETLQILRQLFTELSHCPVLVLATYRPTEGNADLGAAQAALAGARCEELELDGLAAPDVAHILHRVSGTVVAADDARQITTRTAGNPLFVSEIARLIEAEGIAAARLAVPAGIRHVLQHRLAAVPDTAQATLRHAAVLGLEVDIEVLLALDPNDEDTVLGGVESALRAGLLNETVTGGVRFSHALVRDLVYDEIPRSRRVRMHARALEVLESAGGVDVAVLAHHALASARSTTAFAAARLAGEAAASASARSAHLEAAALLQHAVRVLDLPGRATSPGEASLRLDLLCALVSAQAHTGNVLAARAHRQAAIRWAETAGGFSDLVRACTAYDAPALWTVHAYQQTDAGLVEDLEQLLQRLSDADPRARCQVLAALAIEVDTQHPQRAEQASLEALHLARQLGEAPLLCRALNARYLAISSDPQAGAELARIGQEQLALATAAELPGYQAQGHQIMFMAALSRHDLHQAQWHVDRAVEHATTGQLGLALGVLGMFEALKALVQGRFDDAEARYAQISAQLTRIGDPNAGTFALLVRFCVELARGGSGTQTRMAAIAEESAAFYQQLGPAIAEPYTRALIAAGRIDDARAVWTPQTPVQRDYYWLLWNVFRAENALHLGDVEVMSTSYRQLSPYAGQLPEIVHGHVTSAPVDLTLGDLAAALGRPGEAAGHYRRALALAEQIGAPHWREASRQALIRTTGQLTSTPEP